MLFVRAQDLARVEILASVDESDIGRITEGQEVHFGVQAYADRQFEGHVQQVSLRASTQDNVVTYGVAVDNEDGALLPGMTATIDVVIEKVENALVVWTTALRFRPTGERLGAQGERNRSPQVGEDGAVDGSGGPRQTGSAGERRGRGLRQAGAGQGRAGGGAERSGGIATLWYETEDGVRRTARVRTGLTDGVQTAVTSPSEAVQPGLPVIAAVTTVACEVATVGNPFQQQQSTPPRGRGGPR